MRYHTWSTDGFGICVNDILKDINLTVEKVLKLAAMEPSVYKIVQEYMEEFCENKGISKEEFEIDDFDELEGDGYEPGLTFILLNVITEIPLVWADDYGGDDYLLYCPTYPWRMKEDERNLSEEDVVKIFSKYINVLTDLPINVDYYSVENGG